MAGGSYAGRGVYRNDRKAGATAELATEDTSKLEIEAFKQSGEPAHKLGPYLHLMRGQANLQIAILGMVTNKEETLKQAVADLEKVKQLEPDKH